MSSSETKRAGLQGYTTNHEFGGMRIPIPVQSAMLRDYAAKLNLQYILPVGEYFFPNCYVQLKGILQKLSKLDGVVMYSLFMLPKCPKERMEIYEAFLRENSALHCIFETLVVRTREDVEKAEAIYAFQEALEHCPKTIPRELLPELSEIDSFT